MKKKLISTTLILAALVSFNINAQQPVNTAATCTESTACHKADNKDNANGTCSGRTADCKDGKCHHNEKGGRKGKRPDLFKGITLTPEQQSQIEALRPARPEGKAKDAKEPKADKAKGDRKDQGKMRDGERRGNRHMEYISKVKEILTPEQYVVFLENIVSQPQPRHNGPRHSGKRHHHDGGARTVCPEEGNCPAQATK